MAPMCLYFLVILWSFSILKESRAVDTSSARYRGCFAQATNLDALLTLNAGGGTTIDSCITACTSTNPWVALQGTSCYCGSGDYETDGNAVGDGMCDTACTGDANMMCGGTAHYSVYSTRVCADGKLSSVTCGLQDNTCTCDQDCHCVDHCSDNGCEGGVCSAGYSGNKCQTACSSGTYGSGCTGVCRCASDADCRNTDGDCGDKTCQAGYMGSDCQTSCSSGTFGSGCSGVCRCASDSDCRNTDGDCRDKTCQAGYMGADCQTSCSSGTFGFGCSGVCRCASASDCRNTDGYCGGNDCQPGYMGSDCQTACTAGTFGGGCGQQCHCESGAACDVISGVCTGNCAAGYMDTNCQTVCAAGKFGVNCGLDCGHCATGETCDPVTGSCSGSSCDAGWKKHPVCDTACEDGKYGTDCSGLCNCHDGEVCNKATGSCTTCAKGRSGPTCMDPCLVGFFDLNCVVSCPCLSGYPCDGITGECQGGDRCGVGRRIYPACSTVCNPGTHGENCETECGKCGDGTSCDVMTGECMKSTKCAAGYKGHPLCKTQCDDGEYGINCASSCQCSEGDVCDKETGTCEHPCPPGKKGAQCDQDCQSGRFGANCQRSCHCSYGVACNMQSGVCPNNLCDPMWTGDNCQEMVIITTLVPSTTPLSEGSGSDLAPVIGGVVAAVILLAALIGILIYKLRKRQQNTLIDEEGESKQNGIVNPSIKSDTEKVEEEGIYSTMEIIQYRTKLEDLEDYIKQNNREPLPFCDEYERLLKNQTAPWLVGSDERIMRIKNKYFNIIAYDHSRVKLSQIEEDPLSDYINASYIDGYQTKACFIASQGPIKTTLEDFWRLIWEKNVPLVVMVTNLLEDNRPKCEKYWPDEDNIEIGDINITLMKQEYMPDYIIRHLKVEKDDEARVVKQMHFISWPDHGVPKHATPLLSFRRKMKSEMAPAVGPTLIHCSAGVGRTGTLISIDYLLEQAETEGIVDVFNCVRKLRNNRVNMVQTVEQYGFIYSAILETLTVGDTTVPCYKFKEIYPTLLVKNEKTGRCKLQEQLRMLDILNPVFYPHDFEDTLIEGNKDRNRDMNILPPNRHRPLLRTKVEGSTDYINAVYVPGYRRRDAFLVTQLPLKNTQVDFWRMTYEHLGAVIISLQDVNMDDPEEQYWPEMEKDLIFGPFCIKCTKSEQDKEFPGITRRDIIIDYEQGEPRDVPMFELKWEADDGELGPTAGIIALCERIIKEQQRIGERRERPVVVQCRDGFTHCGIYLAITGIIEMINAEQEVDVFINVKQIRNSRPQFVSDQEQYEYLYQISQSYMELYDTYANFQ